MGESFGGCTNDASCPARGLLHGLAGKADAVSSRGPNQVGRDGRASAWEGLLGV